jgi:hypothetical protein
MEMCLAVLELLHVDRQIDRYIYIYMCVCVCGKSNRCIFATFRCELPQKAVEKTCFALREKSIIMTARLCNLLLAMFQRHGSQTSSIRESHGANEKV